MLVGKITERQVEYIRILSSYESSHDADLKDIEDFLTHVGKRDILELSKQEGHNLIEILLRRGVVHKLECGIEVYYASKKDYNHQRLLHNPRECILDCDMIVCDWGIRETYSEKVGFEIDLCRGFRLVEIVIHVGPLREISCESDIEITRNLGCELRKLYCELEP